MKKIIVLYLTLLLFTPTPLVANLKVYEIYIDGNLTNSFENYDDAHFYAKNYENSHIFDINQSKWIWHNKNNFRVEIGNNKKNFFLFKDAVEYAKNEACTVIFNPTNSVIWENNSPDSSSINVPVVLQMPKYQRGCSVATLAMVLNHAGIKSDLAQLVKDLRINPAKEEIKNGITYFGNPYNGFVGDIFSFKNPGLGVYYPPILELMESFLGDSVINFVDAQFDDLLYYISTGHPLWVMTNAKHKLLEDKDFITWYTEDGPIEITKWMHAVVVSGYDAEYIYFSDPLGRHSKAIRKEFIEAWEQMGHQAVGYTSNET